MKANLVRLDACGEYMKVTNTCRLQTKKEARDILAHMTRNGFSNWLNVVSHSQDYTTFNQYGSEVALAVITDKELAEALKH